MAKTTSPAPKAMQADSMMDDLTPAPEVLAQEGLSAAELTLLAYGTEQDAATDAPDLSGPAPTPDAAGADNSDLSVEELLQKAETLADENLTLALGLAGRSADTVAKADADAAAAEAQAKADAEAAAAAEAQAKADAEAAELAAQAAEAPAVDVERLQLLIGQIDRLNHTGHRLGLIDELSDVYGMGILDMTFAVEPMGEDGPYSVVLAGIQTDLAPSMETALTNWANAARRAIMAAAA